MQQYAVKQGECNCWTNTTVVQEGVDSGGAARDSGSVQDRTCGGSYLGRNKMSTSTKIVIGGNQATVAETIEISARLLSEIAEELNQFRPGDLDLFGEPMSQEIHDASIKKRLVSLRNMLGVAINAL